MILSVAYLLQVQCSHNSQGMWQQTIGTDLKFNQKFVQLAYIPRFWHFQKLDFPKKFFDWFKAKAIHLQIFPHRRHISDSLCHGIFEFCPLSYWWIKITDFLKFVHSLEPVQILSFLALNSPFLKRFYIIIDNYINALKILTILSILDLQSAVHHLS